jgi:uncharacterized protein (TIGR02172 family)
MQPGPLLAEGRTAEIFEWEEGQVLKLFRPDWGKDHAEYEHRIARLVNEAGLHAPAVGEMLQVDGRYGMAYEKLEGKSLLWELQARPWRLVRHARLEAALHAAMHKVKIPVLPTLKPVLQRRISQSTQLSQKQRDEILSRLLPLPDGEALCHGDFHPDNVMMTDSGAVVIDWVDAKKGHPLADVARTVLLHTMTGDPGNQPLPGFIRLFRNRFNDIYLGHYFQLRQGSRDELEAWMLPVAAARLAEEVPGEQARLTAYVERKLGSG